MLVESSGPVAIQLIGGKDPRVLADNAIVFTSNRPGNMGTAAFMLQYLRYQSLWGSNLWATQGFVRYSGIPIVLKTTMPKAGDSIHTGTVINLRH